MKTILSIVFILFTSVISVFSGTINGVVRDARSGLPISGAIIRIDGTAMGARSVQNGKFGIVKVPAGKINLKVSMIGYENAEQSIMLLADTTIVFVELSLIAKAVNTGDIVVSAGKRTQTLQEVPVTIALMDQNAIQQRNNTRIDEALRYVPGVNIARDQVNIRGSSGFALGIGSRVALLLDGFPMLSADNGDMKFDALPMMEVERVEVIKGAGSALYGTGALGGVVSLFTRKPTDTLSGKVRTYGGIYTQPRYEQWRVFDSPPELYGVDASASMRINKFEFLALGGIRFDRSYRLFEDSKRWNGFLKTGYTFDDKGNTKINLFVNAASEDKADWVYWNSLDSATRPPTGTNLNRRTVSDKLATAAEFRHFFEDQSFLLIRSGIFQTEFRNTGLLPTEEEISSKALASNSEIQYSASLAKGIFLTSGANFTYNRVNSRIYGIKSQIINSVYTQAEFKPFEEEMIFTIGARLDNEKTDGAQVNTEISPKIGFNYTLLPGIQLRASAGRGFRAPTVAERYAALRFQGVRVEPNLAILPEQSWSFEIGSSALLPSAWLMPIMVDFSYFQNEMRDLVEPLFTPVGTVQFQNVTKARVQGIELTARTGFTSWLGWESSITLMRPRDLILDQTLAYRSAVLWYNRAMLTLFTGLEVQADYRFISRIETIDQRIVSLGFIVDADARVPVHALDIRFIARGNDLMSVPVNFTLNIRNALDYYFSEILGNLAPNRQITLQAEYNF